MNFNTSFHLKYAFSSKIRANPVLEVCRFPSVFLLACAKWKPGLPALLTATTAPHPPLPTTILQGTISPRLVPDYREEARLPHGR